MSALTPDITALLSDMALDVANAENLAIDYIYYKEDDDQLSFNVIQMDAARSALHAVVGAAKYSELMIDAYLTLRGKE